MNALLTVGNVRREAIDGIADDAGKNSAFRSGQLFFARPGDSLLESGNILAGGLNALLHVDHRDIGDDAQHGIKQVADLALPVLARFGPDRRHDKLVLGR